MFMPEDFGAESFKGVPDSPGSITGAVSGLAAFLARCLLKVYTLSYVGGLPQNAVGCKAQRALGKACNWI